MIFLLLACGLMYVLKKSSEIILLTAIMDEEIVDVIAMKMSTNSPAVAPVPNRLFSTYGMTRPELTCFRVRVSGYAIQTGVFSIARADRPMIVPVHQGMAMIAMEARS